MEYVSPSEVPSESIVGAKWLVFFKINEVNKKNKCFWCFSIYAIKHFGGNKSTGVCFVSIIIIMIDDDDDDGDNNNDDDAIIVI